MKTLRRFFRWVAGLFRAPVIPAGKVCDDCRHRPAAHALDHKLMLCPRCYADRQERQAT